MARGKNPINDLCDAIFYINFRCLVCRYNEKVAVIFLKLEEKVNKSSDSYEKLIALTFLHHQDTFIRYSKNSCLGLSNIKLSL